MPTSNLGQRLLGLAIGLASHSIAFLFGFIAGRLVQPSEGGGFEDIAAVALVFLGTDAIIGLAALIGGGVLIAKGRRDLGITLIAGWLIGVVAIWLFPRN
ncbi:MAG TPA: hypothetical protein DGG94_18520 [Micromonosporaceae bacterium]|nr:hypothetical protein [Micromonosporaceae bacterium]HCU51764.1 hypothetical protein [Micromonosporaceae bacterium]